MEYGKYSNDLYELQVNLYGKITPVFVLSLLVSIMKACKVFIATKYSWHLSQIFQRCLQSNVHM